ncbi:TPA: HU family DNA-binding protein [Escherichia coli]|nr:HU family DNA-binding protein [Salmonella enterica subsp. enterica]EBL7042099.1 HU family DNA-binding protein [Salmonella enterica]EHQ9605826.1 HU family DNA-binding protein [Salmonella enterica]EJF7575677.1 HU family DNA-binding protein [Salmonella enterica subsp. enterica]HAV7961478.1 HU family DNA-binding protein [Escherichia coli]
MTKSELISAIAGEFNVSKAIAGKIIDAYADHLKTDLQESGVAVVHGIGRLKLVERAPRLGRNPKTGEEITIPAAKVVKLSVSKELKDAVNV